VGLEREILAGLKRCLHAHAGLELPDWVVETRALARMSALDLGAEAYLDLVRTPRGAAERGALVEAVRVGETRFFRHRPHVDALLEVVVPAWRDRGERSPRVWSAGCATGEEAYTLALVLGRALPRPTHSPTILATDVSDEALAIARRATYPASAFEGVPEPWQGGLILDGDSVRVRPEVAALVTFERQNLADADLPRGFDLVWCRNVLIYFGAEARKRVLAKLVAALEPGGFLFVGYSETLRDVAGLRAVRHADQVVYQKAHSQREHTAEPRKATEKTKKISVDLRDLRGEKSAPAPKARPVQPSRPPAARAVMRVTTSDPAALAADIRAALRAPGLETLTIDLDTASFLDDAAAPVLKRAMAAAESAKIALSLRATRPGPQRWLRRNGLAGGGE
jgi:chemotaxis protein methyltransferase CheR